MRRAAALVALALIAGCGAERREPPDVATPADPERFETVARPAPGVRSVALPAAWTAGERPAPLVATTRSGTATIALWRYERTEDLPRSAADLRAARRRLADAARIRDPSFRLRRSRTLRVDGAPAIQLVGDTTIDGRPRRVRSTHVFADGAELVLDAYAAPEHFAATDAQAFRPVLRSLELG